jgi:hypothetical protein
MSESGRRCPCCSGNQFRFGDIPDSGGSLLTGTYRLRFKPDGNWITTYQLRAFACLSCGFVGLCLHEGDIAALKEGG